MKRLLFATCVLGLAACQGAEPVIRDDTVTDTDAVIDVITKAGCQVDPSNADAVAEALDLSPEGLRAVGEELVSDGQADVSTFGILKLKTEGCR